MKIQRTTKGFTLVEIMIVVVIIGLLAAMAIPAFQKVRRQSIAKAMANDARQIGYACQQILMAAPAGTFANDTITISYNNTSGVVACNTTDNATGKDWVTELVSQVGKGYVGTSITYNGTVNAGATAFTMQHPRIGPADVSSNASASNTVNTAVNFDPTGQPL